MKNNKYQSNAPKRTSQGNNVIGIAEAVPIFYDIM